MRPTADLTRREFKSSSAFIFIFILAFPAARRSPDSAYQLGVSLQNGMSRSSSRSMSVYLRLTLILLPSFLKTR